MFSFSSRPRQQQVLGPVTQPEPSSNLERLRLQLPLERTPIKSSSSPSQRSATPSQRSATPPPGVSRARRKLPKKDYAEEKTDKDISSESEDDWKKGSADESKEESEDDLEDEPVSKKRNYFQEKKSALFDTDEEEGDTEEIRDVRRRVKSELHDLILEKLNQEAPVDPNKWVPDEEDGELLKEWFIAPLMKNSKNFMRFGKKDKQRVQQQVMKGDMFADKEGKELGEYATTASMYLSGLKVFLGLYQEELAIVNPDCLVDSRLHLWQFFQFKKKNHIMLPLTINNILEKVETPIMRQNTFAGYRQLVTSMSEFLATEAGWVLFKKRSQREMNLDEVDMAKEARQQRSLEIGHCENIISQLKKNKPYAKFKREREMLADGRNMFKEKFEGYEVPDPKVAIPLYLSHTTTRNLYNKMVEWAMHKYICTAKEMAKLSHDFVQRLHLKNGHRIQVFKLFKRRHYMEAINRPAKYPYKGVTGGEANEKIFKDDDGQQFTVLENPHEVDLSGVTEDERQEWELLQGIAAKIEKHKTGVSYPCYIWFSAWDQVYMKAYEEISSNFMKANKINFSNQSPFFINSKVVY